jgi:Tfp pilus assembly protein PilV
VADATGTRGDAGFTLVETVVCVALLVTACVSALALVPTLVHASQSALLRDAATTIARTEIERVHAATAYYPPSGYAANHAYALNATTAYTTTAHLHRNLCNGAQTTTDVSMNVAVAYAPATDSVTVTVDYPRNACDPSARESVALAAQLAPSALVPGTTVGVPIDDPAQQ